MKFNVDLPCKYSKDLLKMAPFDENGRITKRVSRGVENLLYLYSNLAKRHSLETENNPANFLVKKVHLIGSGARENKIISDLDILLLCPKIDEKSANSIKEIISYVLFCDRPKNEAIDVYIRAYDKYVERGFRDITSQVKVPLKEYNSILLDKSRSCPVI